MGAGSVMLPFAIIGSMLAEKGLSMVGDLINKGGDKVVDVISEKTGIDLKAKDSLTFEEAQRLREFQSGEEFKRLQLQYDDKKLDVEVTKSAQNMQIEALKQDDLFSKRFVYYFAAAWSIFAMVFIMSVIFIEIPKENIRFADTILGFLLGTIISAIIQFFYGSSLGSKKATEALMNKG